MKTGGWIACFVKRKGVMDIETNKRIGEILISAVTGEPVKFGRKDFPQCKLELK